MIEKKTLIEMKNLKNFSKVKVLIVGDVMLDRYCWGSVSRISPEAPVPVVDLTKTSVVAGGAANVAANVAGLGAQPFLVGVVGDDEEAKLFPKVLSSSKVSSKYLIKIPGRKTTVKTRIVAHQQQVARIDWETKEFLTTAEEDKVWQKLAATIKSVDVVIISDYLKGVLTESLLSRLITNCNENKKMVLVDPKGKNFSKYKNATLLTPNRLEVSEACKLENQNQSLLEETGKKLISELSLEAILITQGEDGMTLIEKNENSRHIKASARDVYDVTGAGDTVIACLAAALGCGYNFIEAAKLANLAAGSVIEHIGTTPIDVKMLQNAYKEVL